MFCDELEAVEVEDSGSVKVFVFYLLDCLCNVWRHHDTQNQSDGIFQFSTFLKYICLYRRF